MITEFRPVAWGDGEPVSASKLSMMAANEQFLFESLPKLYFSNNSIKKDRGIKVFATTAIIPPTTIRHGRTTVYFGDVFSVGCMPVVTLSINATPKEQFHLAIKGIGQVIPDHRGVELLASAAELNSANNTINYNIYAHVIAVGF